MSATPDTAIQIRRLQQLGNAEIQDLSEVLIDCVEGGASVGFMLPISPATAATFWCRIADAVRRDELNVLAAYDDGGCIVGTVQLILQQPQNQPHRADLTKMLVHRRSRCHGVGGALLAAAERSARKAGKTLLVLNTASTAAERLCVRQGWQRCGAIPNYSLLPNGQPCTTIFFFKTLL